MTEPLYIWIPNWDGPDGFQHYKSRDPIWIKNYTRLLSHDAYGALSYHLRGILHSIWLEYATSSRQLRGDTLTLTRRLGHRVMTRDLEALNRAGFIELVASNVLAERLQAASETLASRAPAPSQEPEPEEELVKDPSNRSTTTPSATATTAVPNGNGQLDVQTELLLAKLLTWIGNDADERTAAVIRHNLAHTTEHTRTQLEHSLTTARPRHRARYIVGALKRAAERGTTPDPYPDEPDTH
jgi:hypothetical protein